MENNSLLASSSSSVVATNKMLRNTYLLLSLTLAFSALTGGLAMVFNAPPMNPWITIGGYFLLLFLTSKYQNSALGLAFVFALTGWMGFTLGPIINAFTASAAGTEIVMTALGGTAIIFFGMSGLALFSQKDFSFLGKFIFAGVLVAFIAGVAGLVFEISGLSLAVSAMFLFLSSMLILWQTSQIVNGGETNYISATVTLYVSIYNIFLSLLNLLSAFSGDD